MEKLVLFGGGTAKTWSAEEATMESATDCVKTGGPSLHWHITVDHHAGEAKYPIGWPRTSHAIAESMGDWSAWDYLHLWIHTSTSREALPRDPAGLTIYAPDRASSYERTLSELKQGEWVEIRIPISQIPRANAVRGIQFHLAEEQYRHQDTLDFHIDDLALLRYAGPTLLDFTAVNAVMFADARHLPVSFRLAGVKPDERRLVSCELRREGHAAARATVEAGRGTQRVALDAGQTPLIPGDYELTANVEGGTSPATARVRVIESPWQ